MISKGRWETSQDRIARRTTWRLGGEGRAHSRLRRWRGGQLGIVHLRPRSSRVRQNDTDRRQPLPRANSWTDRRRYSTQGTSARYLAHRSLSTPAILLQLVLLLPRTSCHTCITLYRLLSPLRFTRRPSSPPLRLLGRLYAVNTRCQPRPVVQEPRRTAHRRDLWDHQVLRRSQREA